METFKELIKGKKILIFGVGRQGGGTGDAAWLKASGAEVRLSDKNLELSPEGQTQEQIDWADLIIKNPGVSDDHELIKYAHAKNIPVLTSIAVFVKYCGIPVIAVTGTRGKSTTTELIASLLEAVYPGRVIKGGNIPGTSGLALLDAVGGKKYAVLELSSFQLHNFHDLQVSPHIAVITNLYPDHLNRYSDMASYAHDKEAIVTYQKAGDYALYNADNQGAVGIATHSPGNKIAYTSSEVMSWQTSLPGLHNRENIAAMFAVAKILQIPEEVCKKVVQDFHGVPSRIETVRVLDEVCYINDTTATTPVASLKALQAMTRPTIWITGGDSKNLPFAELIEEVKNNTYLKKIIILGSKNITDYTDALTSVAGDKVINTVDSMQAAVSLAHQHAQSGDAVLLSPGFASFDLFENEFDRGKQFNTVVANLASH